MKTKREQIIDILTEYTKCTQSWIKGVHGKNQLVIDPMDYHKIADRLEQQPISERPVIEQIVLEVLDGMVGIGGIPGNEDFCNEFDMRLRAAMDVSQPDEPISEERIEEKPLKRRGSRRFVKFIRRI